MQGVLERTSRAYCETLRKSSVSSAVYLHSTALRTDSMAPGPNMCPVYEISREDFRRPFVKWVGDVFRANPDLPMFKVRPPKGWSPRFEEGPLPLDEIDIQAPITQHAFGTRGTYRCVLVENKTMSVAEFKALALADDHLPPKKGHEDDKLLERAFWSSITINPPLYGSDNPWSLFDKKLRWGWNLRNLGDLLQDSRVASIPGVTTPMVYFGMWKSFFSWHTEDCDLYSINYLHTGASKAWYCIAPSDRPKFEAMARKEFPALYNNCKGFMRHKDLMFSPSMLRTHNVPFVQAKQEEGEFVVLNTGAYHAGFNMGFNCAEAINFAIPEWIPVGRAAVPCKCDALQDRVRIDMRLWCPDIPEPKEEQPEPESSYSSQEEEEEVKQPGTPPPSQPRKRGRADRAAVGTATGKVRKKVGKAAGKTGSGGGKTASGSIGGKQVRKRKSRATGRPVGRPRKDGKALGMHTPLSAIGKGAAKEAVGAAVDINNACGQEKAARVVKNLQQPKKAVVSRMEGLAAGPIRGRVMKAGAVGSKQGGAASHRKMGGTATRAPLPSYLQNPSARNGNGLPSALPSGRRTATSARAVGKRSLRSTVPILPHDVSLPDKLHRPAPRVRTAPCHATASAQSITAPDIALRPSVSPQMLTSAVLDPFAARGPVDTTILSSMMPPFVVSEPLSSARIFAEPPLFSAAPPSEAAGEHVAQGLPPVELSSARLEPVSTSGLPAHAPPEVPGLVPAVTAPVFTSFRDASQQETLPLSIIPLPPAGALLASTTSQASHATATAQKSSSTFTLPAQEAGVAN